MFVNTSLSSSAAVSAANGTFTSHATRMVTRPLFPVISAAVFASPSSV